MVSTTTIIIMVMMGTITIKITTNTVILKILILADAVNDNLGISRSR